MNVLHEKLEDIDKTQEALKAQVDEQKAKIEQLEQQNMAIMMGMVDVYSAITTGGQEQ